MLSHRLFFMFSLRQWRHGLVLCRLNFFEKRITTNGYPNGIRFPMLRAETCLFHKSTTSRRWVQGQCSCRGVQGARSPLPRLKFLKKLWIKMCITCGKMGCRHIECLAGLTLVIPNGWKAEMWTVWKVQKCSCFWLQKWKFACNFCNDMRK